MATATTTKTHGFRLRLIPAIDEMPAALRFAESRVGSLVLVAVFALALALHGMAHWRAISLALVASTLWPSRRRLIVAVATAWFWLRHMPVGWGALREMAHAGGLSISMGAARPAALAATVLACAGVLLLVRSDFGTRRLRHPVATLLTAYFLLFVAIAQAPMSEALRCGLFAFVLVFRHFVWFLGYALIHREPGVNPLLQVGLMMPFWQGAVPSTTPFPKGGGHLAKIESEDAAALAVCQLKGLKLVAWAGVLVIAQRLLHAVAVEPDPRLASLGLTGGLHIPGLRHAMEIHASGGSLSWGMRLGALVYHFLNDLLAISVWGHLIVACCRMAGFRALRNTRRPLESASIAEFWNRYYFYYKELLVDFFFYPAFLRFFKRRPVLRRFFATLCAATFGNTFFHFMRDFDVEHGLVASLRHMDLFAFYATVLGIGIGVSQMRTRRKRPTGWHRRIGAPLAVLSFYCALSVFLVKGDASLLDRCTFLLALVGWR